MAAKRHGAQQAAAMEAIHSYGISQLPNLLKTALEFHSQDGRFGGTCLGCPGRCPVMRHKNQHGRKAA
jgi:hypothetical protein